MLSLIAQTFLVPFIIACIMSVGFFVLGYRVVQKRLLTLYSQQADMMSIDSIAGDNVWSTQLDLARAYLESDQAMLAKTVIEDVAKHADVAHQNEAVLLLKAHF